MIGSFVATLASPQLSTAAWDILSLLKNSKTWLQTAGGLLLMLLGVAGLVVGGVFLIIKLMGSAQSAQKHGWGQIVMLLLAGGALAAGGLALISKLTSGSKTTIEQLGGGDIIAGLNHLGNLGSILPSIPGLF